MRLSKDAVARLALPEGKAEAFHWDDALRGFGLRLRAGGSATWLVQYRVGARQRREKLGRWPAMDADAARKAAKLVLAKVGLGHDPQAEKRERLERAAVTFGAVAESYLARSVAQTQRPKTLGERRRHIERDWKPFHRRPLHEITRRDVAARLQVIADEHGPIASNRARGTLSAFYAWAIGQGLAEANPVIGTVRVGAEQSRSRVLSLAEIAEVWAQAGVDEHAHILRLLLLTGQRRGEVAALRWSEIDFGRAVWTLPAERSKNGLPHDVPLAPQALAILREVPQRPGRDLLFGQGSGPFSGWSQCKARLDARIARQRAAKRLGRALLPGEKPEPQDSLPAWTLHDLRRTVVTHMNELGIAPHVVEAVVNHISGRARAGVAGVYNRATYATEKRAALHAWAEQLDAALGQGERKVIPLRA